MNADVPKEARDLMLRTLPVLGSHPRGFAQELLAEMCLYLGCSPYDWTGHPEVLTSRIAMLPKKQQRGLERRKTPRAAA